MRPSSPRWLWLALGGVLGAAAPVYGQPPADGGPEVFTWRAPLGCPTERDAVQEIERLLGRPLDASGGVRVRGTIERGAEGFRLVVLLEQGDTESRRALADASCEGLTRAGALVIALAIDPTVLASLEETEPVGSEGVPAADPTEPTPEGTQPVAPVDGAREPGDALSSPELPSGTSEPRPTEARVRVSSPSRPRDDEATDEPAPEAESTASGPPPSPRFIGQLTGLLSAGPLPAVGPGGGLAAGFGYDALELTLGGYVIAPQPGLLDDVDAGGTVGLAAGVLRGCASFEVEGLLEVLPCASFEAGAAWATGVGVPVVRSGAAPWLAVGAGARVRLWFFDVLGLEATAELQVPLLRAPFVLTLSGERREFHRASEAGGVFGLGVVFRAR